MSLIKPGFEIHVSREIVPRPLGAAGVLGIIGCTEKDLSSQPLQTLGSFQEFVTTFGKGSLVSMPEVKQAFTAGLNKVVVSNIPAGKAAFKALKVMVDGKEKELRFEARTNGVWGNSLYIRLLKNEVLGERQLELKVFYPDWETEVESFAKLSGNCKHERYLLKVINEESAYIKARFIVDPLSSTIVPVRENPIPEKLSAGEDPTLSDYERALNRLESASEVDMVTASQNQDTLMAATIYATISAHCQRMSNQAKPRIGYGQVTRQTELPQLVSTAKEMASRLVSERFVLVAPFGYLGAMIGMIAGLEYYESPTFKPLPGVSSLKYDFTDSNLDTLIQAGVCAVDEIPRKGIACVKGITTDGDQISVRRIADRAVRHVKNIAQDFIGLLNSEEQRLSLKQRITEALTKMEREGALVPNLYKKSPAFEVSVESTPEEFAQGEVRVGIAIRPVRAIDYIYANMIVKAF